MLRTAQQGPEALRASAVEAAFTERRRGEAGREIAIEPRDRFVRTGVRDDAIAVGEEARGATRGVMSHGALPHEARANGATLVSGVATPGLASRSGVSRSRQVRTQASGEPCTQS